MVQNIILKDMTDFYEFITKQLVKTASRSTSNKKKVGAVLAKPSETLEALRKEGFLFITSGFNYDTECPSGPCEDENGKTKDTVIHAEVACLNSAKSLVRNGWDITGAVMYITHEPCLGCQAALKQANIPWEVIKMAKTKKPEQTKLDATLQERGSVYGTFADNASCTQAVMDVLQTHAKRELSDFEREALHMVAHKMSRIVCGLKTKKDNWHDIAGYAKLAEDLTDDE